jgi:hypothetical protein
MADQQQLAILRAGVEQWNAWRMHNSGTPVDLTEAELCAAQTCIMLA